MTCQSPGLGYFNLARGLGMALILLGHSMTPFSPADPAASGAGSVLGGGIMAMFFLISGMGFYCRSPKKCFSIQCRLLLKPYLLTTAAILLTKLVLASVKQRPFAAHGGELVLTYLLGLNAEGGGQLWGVPIESVSIFWFILALWGGWLLYNGICRLHNKPLQILLVMGCVGGSYLLTLISSVWIFCLPMVLLSVGYLAAGDLIRTHQLLDRKLPAWCWVILLTITGICACFGGANLVGCYWKLGLLDVAGSFCVGFLLLRLYRRFMEKAHDGLLIRMGETIGFHSFWIIFLHGYEKVIFPWYRLGEWMSGGAAAVVCLAARCAVMYGLFRLLKICNRKCLRKRKKTISF